MKTNIIVAGYGVFGSGLIDYINRKNKEINIIKIIEPNRHKRDVLKKLNYEVCESVYELSDEEITSAHVLVDCSPRGEGIKNKKIYKELGIKAIFQNGEEDTSIGQLYYPGLVDTTGYDYLLMPLCSGMSAIKVLDALRKRGLPLPKSVSGLHSKVTNTARMLTPNYSASNNQILELFGIRAKMDVVYLRGEPHQGKFTYYGKVQLCYQNETPDLKPLVAAISEHPLLETASADVDLLTGFEVADKSVIVEDSIRVEDGTISFISMSNTPEVNYPVVVSAIKDLAAVDVIYFARSSVVL